ncbi:hypothetical protein NHH03_25195 [Stieleria sp. TO1_6]|uniref:hypothetical protein n=1 Tax=Stieleria tagensis TaxID=2956795 RepID=UPI00209A98B2|nr:hypothetical protein [Stieleria tagensis]MCO8125057.1 hypothetical protein [Stieleria tagensis]
MNPKAITAVSTANPGNVTRHDAGTKLCLFLLLSLCVLWQCVVQAADPGQPLPVSNAHPLYNTSLPPGVLGQRQLAMGMQMPYFQPVAFSGPSGTAFSLPENGSHGTGETNLMAGLMVGAVYRFRITGIPNAIGAEVYPTVELIGRTFAPPGLETKYPIPINLSETDLQEALDGNLVTRVIYLEDPQSATPLALKRTDSRPIDIPIDQDAMATADSLGRPIAIVRIGSKSPPNNPALEPQFYFGYPPWAPIFQPEAP